MLLDQRVFLVSLVQMELLEHPVHLDKMASKVLLDQPVYKVILVIQDLLDLEALLVFQVL